MRSQGVYIHPIGRTRPSSAPSVALAPDDSISHIVRAKCLFSSGEIGAALNAAETGAKIPGAPPEAEDAPGAVFGLLGRRCRALEISRRAAASLVELAEYPLAFRRLSQHWTAALPSHALLKLVTKRLCVISERKGAISSRFLAFPGRRRRSVFTRAMRRPQPPARRKCAVPSTQLLSRNGDTTRKRWRHFA